MNQLMGRVIQQLKFADGPLVKCLFEEAVTTLLGPKTEADLNAKPTKKKKTKSTKAKDAPDVAQTSEVNGTSTEGETAADPYAFFSKPEENHQVHTTVHFSNGEKMHISNSEEQLKAHLDATGGKYYTRFPPEPNGYLHIGHAKVNVILHLLICDGMDAPSGDVHRFRIGREVRWSMLLEIR